MREPGSGTQQRFEEALQNWGIEPTELNSNFSFEQWRDGEGNY
jgi:hypothetical protein